MNESILHQAGFGEQVDRVKAGRCPTCGKVIDEGEFRDKLSRAEFKISGMCQACQDSIFDEDNIDDL